MMRPKRLGQSHSETSCRIQVKLVCPEGIEPPTHSLEGCCSIQLSYGQIGFNKNYSKGVLSSFGRHVF